MENYCFFSHTPFLVFNFLRLLLKYELTTRSISLLDMGKKNLVNAITKVDAELLSSAETRLSLYLLFRLRGQQ